MSSLRYLGLPGIKKEGAPLHPDSYDWETATEEGYIDRLRKYGEYFGSAQLKMVCAVRPELQDRVVKELELRGK